MNGYLPSSPGCVGVYEGWRRLTESLNPKKKFMLNLGIRVDFSNFNKSLSTAVQYASNSWPLLWGQILKNSFTSWLETRHSELAAVQISTRP